MYSLATTLLAVSLSALVGTPAASAQLRNAALDSGTQPAPQDTLDGELQQMAGQAGVIFAGEVLAIRPQSVWGASSGWVEVDFRVDQAVRGCLGQSTYTLREWSGLWAGGVQRYTVGQRLLMLLHAPSASGLSSPVGGQDGAIPLIGLGAAPGPQDTFATPTDQAVDVRWLEARLLRPAPFGPTQAAPTHATGPRGMVYAGREHAPMTTRKVMRPATNPAANPAAIGSNNTVPLSSTSSRGITLRSVLAMMAAWQAEQANAAH